MGMTCWAVLGSLLIFCAGGLFAQKKSDFSCEGRPSGYYADVDAGCQIYHMCDGLGRQFSYSCPNTTLFQQRMLICDHWYMVNCSKSEEDYSANLLIGQRKKPFVEDSEKHPYQRTPRPDLLSQPKGQEYDIIYRTGRAQSGSNYNLVGAETGQGPNDGSSTGQPYFLPSHWSTEYNRDTATSNPLFRSSNKPTNKPFDKPSFVKPTNKKIQNFKTKDKHLSSERSSSERLSSERLSSERLSSERLSSENSENLSTENSSSENARSEKVTSGQVNSLKIEVTTGIPVNFRSDFQATTPSFPLTVDVTPPSVSEDQLPPLLDPLDGLNFNSSFLNNLKAPEAPKRNATSIIDLIIPPSIYYQTPKFDRDYKNSRTKSTGNAQENGQENHFAAASENYSALDSSPLNNGPLNNTPLNNNPLNNSPLNNNPLNNNPSSNPSNTNPFNSNSKKSPGKDLTKYPLPEKQWKDLRKLFLIPDYDFPLETASRRGYDAGPSSFQVDPYNTRQ